jgi:LysR family transcriptional regulator, nod-box dependent transcriptional activator
MPTTNLRRFNLNALPALREILRQGSLTKASAVLNVTQPALSNILRQLRNDFQDELIVRNGKTMQLTLKGESLLAPLEHSLAALEDVFSEKRFDPAQSARMFRIATTDHIISLISGRLAERILAEAPRMKAQLQIARIASIKELVIGDIDMIITPKILFAGAGLADDATREAVSTEFLISEKLVCIGREDDVALTNGLSIEEYLKRPHASFLFGEKQISSLEHIFLKQNDYAQNDVIFVSSYVALASIAATSGCLAIVPQSIAEHCLDKFPIQVVTPPIGLPQMDWIMAWHQRNDADPFMHWLRNTLLDCVRSDASVGLSPLIQWDSETVRPIFANA